VTRRHTALWIAGAVGLTAALFVGVLATRQSAENSLAASPLAGKAAPALTGQTLAGDSFSLSTLKGRFVVVNFFASWCVPCMEEHPELQKFVQRHQGGDAQLVSVLFDDTPAAARARFKQLGGDWPVVSDPGGQAALDFGVRGPPESFVLDRQGYVLTRIVGRVTADGLDNILSQAKAAGR
jgi:cytochrome c biogenesis protein CcmG/thiol:disulfide interchange protein DsbE